MTEFDGIPGRKKRKSPGTVLWAERPTLACTPCIPVMGLLKTSGPFLVSFPGFLRPPKGMGRGLCRYGLGGKGRVIPSAAPSTEKEVQRLTISSERAWVQ